MALRNKSIFSWKNREHNILLFYQIAVVFQISATESREQSDKSDHRSITMLENEQFRAETNTSIL